MIIIFDFNRTLYDPETSDLVPGALALLSYAKSLGSTMHLVSKLEEGREDRLRELGIASYFASVAFVENKTEAFKNLIAAAPSQPYVIGDHLHNEIRIANHLGARTIWLKRGRFKDLVPERNEDVPWKTIEHLEEAKELLG